VAKPSEVYQIKVTLRGSEPLIWRRIQVKSDTSLAKFHKILQRVMGWEDAHLHRFVIEGEYYGTPEEDERGSRATRDERKYSLHAVVPPEGSHFVYDYDFGDNWQHVLALEKTLAPRAGVVYPMCVAGACACPPEDVGGIGRYHNFLEALANPTHPEHDEFKDWIGGVFDPEAFDLTAINRKLHKLKSD
jgi:Plasmid pRiA4b ORF-3-like protein